ncbi:LysR family transcriptional regulator [Nocardia otitidiscaviarum]|uniref:LysR family transcriptional regulator n=1 Tax=Nocardia otitidiscaviarum TaxID=1823 RepID=A0A516NHB0_9NOCA|nr:LysR family transcriptional regulator [Nocardia otitidiscaviarum]MCP9623534.1 LysR family transcriptional regulator [Nocardia otitidiscaviarum]QDP78288.1 LysR family transcriptional regulator [Nocardia otitidiscaviarum]
MELRDIEIFLTLAEELHFGRTAERLHVSQARVSQAIRKQERRIGTALFERTSRRVQLTPVGRRLRADLQQVHDLLQAALARAEAAGLSGGGTLKIGVFGHAGHELRPLTEAFRTRYPGSSITFGEINGADPFTALRTGDHDVNVVWLPVVEPDLTVGPTVLTGRRVLAVATDHPLAVRGTASLEDLADNHVADFGPDAPEYWVASMVPTRTPQGRRIPRGPIARTFHEIISLVASGRCVHPLGEIAARYNSPPGVVFLPMPDAPELQWALTWRTISDSAAIRALARTAADLGPIRL